MHQIVPRDERASVIWLPTSRTLQLCSGEIDVWRADLECPPSVLEKYRASLSVDEQERADRFYFREDRNHYIASRGILRLLLGWYTNRRANDLRFDYGAQGKPSLGNHVNSAVTFNLSHSQGLAVYAFALRRQLGVDVERIRPNIAIEEIAERYFSPNEMSELRAVPPGDRREAFFLCWTRKEAYIKARGEGLRIALDSFDVSLTPGTPAKFRGGVNEGWNLAAFRAAPGCPAALVFGGERAEIRYYHFSLNDL
jgi:4'-phosphopantetheinyl transferase